MRLVDGYSLDHVTGGNEMREIKFRVWDTANKVMGIVNCYDFDEDKVFYTSEGLKYSQVSGHFILEQFTGLKDKNGKEIYEGDKLHIWSNFYKKDMLYAEVFWNMTKAGFDIKEPNGRYNNWLGNLHKKGWFCEIIGNVHDNPELLK